MESLCLTLAHRYCLLLFCDSVDKKDAKGIVYAIKV